MKFWQKIYLFSLLVFALTFNFAGIFIIEKIHSDTLKRQVEMCLSEHLSIYSGINSSMPMYNTLKRYSRNVEVEEHFVSNFINDYYKYKRNNNSDVYIEVLGKDKKKIFSNIEVRLPDDRAELNLLEENKRQYIIRDIADKSFIFISNNLKINDKIYILTYVKDISAIYEERKNQYFFFIKLNIIVSFVFVIFMYFTSKYITSPIKKLMQATKRITEGDFSEKVNMESKDEFGVLAENFNIMTDVVDEKINELEKNNMEKQRFIENLTHELKTPLTSIIGYADLLRTTKYNEEIFIDGLSYIYKEGKRLEEMSFKLMDLILLKKEEFKMEKINIKSVMFEVKGLLLPKLNSKNIELIINGNDFAMMMEKDLIKILLSNLIDNAIKASKENSEIYINIDKYEIEIKDYGIGIAEEHISKIFEPFYMVDKARTRANNGAGLGLAICRKILDIHQGEFSVKSKINQGTSITLIFGVLKKGGTLYET